MSEFFDPYNADRPLMLKCSCGRDHSPADHHAEVAADAAAAQLRARSETAEFEAYSQEFIEATLVKALFPQDQERRMFLRAVGKKTAMAAIASVLPVASLQALAQSKGPLEKTNLKIGFIPITCATPLIMAEPLGFYQKQGLNVEVTKTAGWALIRDKMINKEYDATHFLSPMPLAISMGLGANATPMNVATIQNINGQAITLAMKHKNNRDPKNWKGFKFAVPFDYSMHNFLLRYYLCKSAWCHHRRWWPICARATSMVSWDLILLTNVRCSMKSALSTCSPKTCGTATPAAPLAPAPSSFRSTPTLLPRCTAPYSQPPPWPASPATAS